MEEETDEISEKIIGVAIEVHKVLGPGLLESIYEQALAFEFGLRGLECKRHVEIDVIYKGCEIKGQRLDMLVGGEVVAEAQSYQNFQKFPSRKFSHL